MQKRNSLILAFQGILPYFLQLQFFCENSRLLKPAILSITSITYFWQCPKYASELFLKICTSRARVISIWVNCIFAKLALKILNYEMRYR